MCNFCEKKYKPQIEISEKYMIKKKKKRTRQKMRRKSEKKWLWRDNVIIYCLMEMRIQNESPHSLVWLTNLQAVLKLGFVVF